VPAAHRAPRGAAELFVREDGSSRAASDIDAAGDRPNAACEHGRIDVNNMRALGTIAVILVIPACGGAGSTVPQIGPVTTVSITDPSSAVALGGTMQLAASATDANGNVVTGLTAAWTTSNPAVATVNGNGLVSGVSVGAATITATISGIAGSTGVSVAPAGATAAVQANTSQHFVPAQVDITAGGTVTWQFSTLTHNVTFSGSAVGTPANIPDTFSANVSRSFTTAGTFAYQCTIHAGMTGTVVVH
jgi:plastocyanin